MKVPINWLREYIDVPADVQEISRVFTSLGYMLDGAPVEVDGDTVLDLEVRQNRGDCLSLIGLAEELSAYYKTPLKEPASDPKLLNRPSTQLITIEDNTKCYRFNTVRIETITNGASPDWMQKRLLSYGITPINTLVDITNYVMLEIGQPLHAFDAAKVHGEIRVGLAQKEEMLTTLSGAEISLSADDIIIRDEKGILALAGIIGGESSKVDSNTQTIILEAATYDQAHIRRASRRHGIRTEASTRLEKLLHPDLTEIALARAVYLIQELTDGTVIDHTDAYPRRNDFKGRKLDLTFKKVVSLSGVEMAKSEIISHLELLGFKTSKENETYCEVSIPFYRTDIEIEEDLIEEVIRLYGYDKIPALLPSGPAPKQIDSPLFLLEESVRDILISCGYDEQITESLTHYDKPGDDVIALQNALTSEKDMLRTTLQDGLVKGVKNREKYRETDIRLFEIGKVYFRGGENLGEESRVGIILSGPDAQYRILKGITESIFARLGRTYKDNLVTIQQLPNKAYYVELSLESILALPMRGEGVHVLTVPPQIIKRDISCTVPKETKVGELLNKIHAISPEMIHVSLGEDPRDVEKGMKSVFVNIEFWSTENKLTEKDIRPLFEQIQEMMRKDFGAALR